MLTVIYNTYGTFIFQAQRKGWTPLLALVCFATTLGTAIPVGYCLGVMNTTAEVHTYIRTYIVAQKYK